MQIAARMREHDALLQLYMFLPTGHPVLLEMAAKGREWHNDKGKPNRPAPHLYKARGFLQATKSMPAVSEAIKAECDRFLRLNDDQLARTIYVCKTTKAFDRAKLRLVFEVDFPERHAFMSLLQSLLPPGSKQIVGVAPRNNLEREIADQLVELGIFSASDGSNEA